jgi:hypothetical protein
MTRIVDTTIPVTGGAKGLGKLMGEIRLRKGANRLIVWDNDRLALNALAQTLNRQGFEVHTYPVDVACTAQVMDTSREILQKFGKVDVLFNNAGIITGKLFEQHYHPEIDKTIQINIAALMHITLELLPPMLASGQGHIVNIASAAGLTANPKMSVYVASKWAVIGWSESLRIELERK